MSARRPSRLGLALTFGLLLGLLAWRWALPGAPVWLDALALAVAGALLWTVRSLVRDRGGRARRDRSGSP